MFVSYRVPVVVALGIVLLFSLSVEAASWAKFEKHDISLTLHVPKHEAKVTDSGTLTVEEGWNIFLINGKAQKLSFTLDGKLVEMLTERLDDTAQFPPAIKDSLPEIESEGNPFVVVFKADKGGKAEFSITYKAEFYEDIDNIRFSNETVGREVSGTILEQGAYLSPSALYYPQGDEKIAKFRLTAVIPEQWESISDGNRLSSTLANGTKTQQWENPFHSDGVMFFAAPFVTRSTFVDSIEVACYFFEADTGLFDRYLKATADYISMYSDMIGPYPYKRFTVVENFFPTGYGMPAWTLLGQQVLRLPFIIRTSLGHEVLHNWWGNSVYVDYERGNWCEAATVYGADYHYKVLQSEEAAKEYRKNILKQYVSYVNEGNDFPIREFTSRTSPNTRTIGYNKAMMVYHMIEQEIGTEPFFQAWKDVYANYIGKQISWEEWIKAFEKTSGKDLSYIIPQWIDRAGAPFLDVKVDAVDRQSKKDVCKVTFTIMEKSGQDYRLHVPIRFAGDTLVLDTTVLLISPESTYTMTVPAVVTSLAVDPDYHLFRKLHPEEIEPVIAGVLGYPQKRFAASIADSAARGMFASFGENVAEDSVKVESLTDILHGSSADFAPIVLNPEPLPEYLQTMVTVTSDEVVVHGSAYPRYGHTFVLAGEKWGGFEKYMVVLTDDYASLPRLGRLVPHYGKYSYLVFEGTKNVGKGQWPVKESPLKKEL